MKEAGWVVLEFIFALLSQRAAVALPGSGEVVEDE